MSDAAKKFKINANYLQKIKAHKLVIQVHTKKPAAQHAQLEEKTITAKLRKLVNKILRKILITNDEYYVLQTPPETPGKLFFHANDRSEVETEDKIQIS